MAGSMMGTPGYMAPEQYCPDEEVVDERADIFAFCAACYLALYGQLPFEGQSVTDIATATLNGQVRAPPASSEVPAWLHRVLLRGLSVTPTARPRTMTELLVELRADPAGRQRRWFAVSTFAAIALTAVFVVHETTVRRVRACHEAADRLGGVWDAPRKQAAASAFRGTGLSYAPTTWGRVERALDAYGSSWADSAERACLATRARGERSEVAYELESACLEERLDGLRALADVLVSADAKTVQNAVKAVHELAPLDACSDLDRLSVVSRPPRDPGARARLRALQGEVAVAKALVDAGKPQQGIQRLDGSRGRVQETHFGPLIVSWTLLRAEAIETSDPRAAAQAYEEAVVEADANRLDELKAEAAILAGTLDADWLDRYEDAHRWLHIARGAVERIGDPPRLEVWLEIEEGWAQVYDGNKTDLFERALERARAAGVDDPRRRASAYAGLAEMAGNLGRPAEACDYDRRSIAEFEEAVGAEHPFVAQYLGDLARDQIDAGKPEDALGSASRALRILDADTERGEVTGESHQRGYVEQQLGVAFLRLGRAREAVDHLSRARDLLRATDGGENRGSLAVNNALAEAHRLVGDPAQAAASLDEDAALEERMRDVDVETADTLVERAKLRLDRGQPETALELAQRALALKAKGTPRPRDGYGMADARLVAARALASCRRSLPQASELAETARDGFLVFGDWQRADDAAQLLAQLGHRGR
jgi:serine/threonine-protein kinase